MNPFELTKDPDGGGITVRVKHGFVVLTREEEKRVTERITEILAENAKLRKLVRDMWPHVRHRARMCLSCELGEECAKSDEPCLLYAPIRRAMHELGIEVGE